MYAAHSGGTTVDKELRTNICRLIAGLVVADDDLSAAEETFLDKILAKFEIPESERDSIFPIVDRDEAAQTIRALPQEARTATLTHLIEATVADGVIAPEERSYLDAVAAEMGLSSTDLDGRIKSALGAKST
jgi:uncharacterized tellurite resistance protein B-like protein